MRYVNNTSYSRSIAATSTSVLAPNPLRHAIILVNSGLVDVWVIKGATASVGFGILLKADGGSYTDNRLLPDESIYSGPYSAITVSGTANLGVTEETYDLY